MTPTYCFLIQCENVRNRFGFPAHHNVLHYMKCLVRDWHTEIMNLNPMGKPHGFFFISLQSLLEVSLYSYGRYDSKPEVVWPCCMHWISICLDINIKSNFPPGGPVRYESVHMRDQKNA